MRIQSVQVMRHHRAVCIWTLRSTKAKSAWSTCWGRFGSSIRPSGFKGSRGGPPGGAAATHFHKHLVVSGDDLYVEDIRWRVWDATVPTAVRAYRLDQQRGRWEEVWSLGGSAFFICSHCTFAVAARELDGCEGDCIYYKDERGCFDRFERERFEAFSLPDRTHKRPGDFAVLYSPFRRGQFIGDWDDEDETSW